MTIEMVYLNPNISKKRADEMVAAVNVKRKEMIDLMFDNAEKLNPKQRCEYIGSCMPFVLML